MRRDPATALAAAEALLAELAAGEAARARAGGLPALLHRLDTATGLGRRGTGAVLAVGGGLVLLALALLGLELLGLLL